MQIIVNNLLFAKRLKEKKKKEKKCMGKKLVIMKESMHVLSIQAVHFVNVVYFCLSSVSQISKDITIFYHTNWCNQSM